MSKSLSVKAININKLNSKPNPFSRTVVVSLSDVEHKQKNHNVRVDQIFEFVEPIRAMLRSFSHLALPAGKYL